MPSPPRRALEVRQLEFISFQEEDSAILRASPLTSILSDGAAVFRDSVGREQDFRLSRPVSAEEGIDVFISHNWAVSRWAKFLSLSFHFNLKLAAAACFAVRLFCLALSLTRSLPKIDFPDHKYPYGWAGSFFSAPSFLIAILGGGLVRKHLGLPGPSVFVDKTCIPQTDKEKQKRAIRKLGAFLFSSRHMLVIYTDIYLRKLWTIYELACFLCLHSPEDIFWVPTALPATSFLMLGLGSLGYVTGTLVEAATGFPLGVEAAIIFLGPLALHLLRIQYRTQRRMLQMATDFTVAASTCACEEDRPVIYHNIANMMRAVEAVPFHASDEEALLAFDKLVRSKLPSLVDAIGKYGLPYKDMIIITTVLFDPLWTDGLTGLAYGMPIGMAVNYLVARNLFVYVCAPLVLAAMGRAARLCPDLRGPCESVAIFVVGLSFMGMGGLYWHLVRDLWQSGGLPPRSPKGYGPLGPEGPEAIVLLNVLVTSLLLVLWRLTFGREIPCLRACPRPPWGHRQAKAPRCAQCAADGAQCPAVGVDISKLADCAD